jgi:hypothetical protein
MNTNDELRTLIQRYGLSRREIAQRTASRNVSTVDRWMAPPRTGRCRNPTFRRMPESKLLLLKLSLQLENSYRNLEVSRH